MKKKLLNIFCAFVIAVTFSVPANAAAPFIDVTDPSYWAYDAIREAKQEGIVKGFPDGKFYPAKFVTAAEVMSSIYSKYGTSGHECVGNRFADVPSSHWAYSAFYCIGYHMFSYPTPSGKKVYPDKPISRERVAYAIWDTYASALPGSHGYENVQANFTDYSSVNPNIREHLNYAVQANLIKGYNDGSFRPTAAITRAEFVTLMLRLKKAIDRVYESMPPS